MATADNWTISILIRDVQWWKTRHELMKQQRTCLIFLSPPIGRIRLVTCEMDRHNYLQKYLNADNLLHLYRGLGRRQKPRQRCNPVTPRKLNNIHQKACDVRDHHVGQTDWCIFLSENGHTSLPSSTAKAGLSCWHVKWWNLASEKHRYQAMLTYLWARHRPTCWLQVQWPST